MSILTIDTKREQLLKLAQEYQEKGYKVSIHPNLEDLPEFLQSLWK
jgi:hypothetical protein